VEHSVAAVAYAADDSGVTRAAGVAGAADVVVARVEHSVAAVARAADDSGVTGVAGVAGAADVVVARVEHSVAAVARAADNPGVTGVVLSAGLRSMEYGYDTGIGFNKPEQRRGFREWCCERNFRCPGFDH